MAIVLAIVGGQLIAFRNCAAVTVYPAGAADRLNSSLEYHLCNASQDLRSDTELVLSPGVHWVQEGDPCVVSNLNSFTIRSESAVDGAEIRCISNLTGRNFIFLNMSNFRVENIAITNCGREIPSDLPAYVNNSHIYFGTGQKAVFLFGHVTNLTFESVIVNRSLGYSMVGMNLNGNIVLHNVTLTNTDNFRHPLCTPQVSDLSCSGSGAVFVNADPVEGELLLSDTNFVVTESTFERNQNIIPLQQFVYVFSSLRSSFTTEPLVLTGATGLSFYSLQRQYNVEVYVARSRFAYNTGYSGALAMTAYNVIREVSFRIDECDFIGNMAMVASRGGGMILIQVSYLDALQNYPNYPDDVYDILTVTRSKYVDNEAEYGGAVYIHSTPQNASDIRTTFDDITFSGNAARSGSAFASVAIQSTFVSRALHILLEDVQVVNNTFPSVLNTSNSTLDNSAMLLFVITQNVTIAGRSYTRGGNFINNNPGVVLASGSNIYLKGHLNFENNYAFRGGAITVIDFSILFFHEGSTITFSRNRALSSGGAIYAESQGTLDSCIIQFIGPNRISRVEDVPRLNLSIDFENNVASDAGNSIFANPIYDCAYLPEASIFDPTTFVTAPGLIYSKIFHVTSSVANGIQELSSRPERLCFCNNTEFKMEYCFADIQPNISVIPGEEFTMYVVPVDKINNPVSAVMFAELNTADIALSSAQTTQRLSGKICDEVTFQIHGMENGNGNLNLYAVLGGQAITVQVTLEECPPGFSIGLQRGLLKCICDEYVVRELSTSCNTTSYTVKRPGNAWLGVIEHVNASDVVFVSTCPVDHCSEAVTEVDLRAPDRLCEPGRKGVLCGACQHGLSIVFGSNDCRKCSNFSIFTIFFYIILGLLLVLLLFLLNLTVTQGTVIGLIFYANLVSVNINIFNHSQAQDFVFVFISLINLELGFPLCFFDGMTEVMKVGFQFIFPVYLLLLSLGIILLVRWSSKMQKLTASNGIHVLATLLYLSYAKILRTVIDSLSIVTLRSEVQEHVIWLYDGNIEYFTKGHIGLVITAVVALLFFLIPYTTVLLFIKQFQRFRNTRLKAVLDAYRAPYKDRYTFWAGLRLLTLAIMCSTYAVLGTDNPSLALMWQLIFITLFIFWQAISKPYRKYYLELLDLFFTMNFIMMAIASLHLLNVDLVTAAHKQKVLVEVLISFVFIAFCGIITFHAILALRRIDKVREKMDSLWNRVPDLSMYKFFRRKMMGEVSKPTVEENCVSLVGVKLTNQHASKTDTTQTTVSMDTADASIEEDSLPRPRKLTTADFSKLREPVLDD